MQVVFRTDASIQIGSGHVMRCLTLADKLRDGGAEITFICREHAGHLSELIASHGCRIARLSGTASSPPGDLAHSHWLGVSQREDAQQTRALLKSMGGCDWLIVDHYGLDAEWETAMRDDAKHIMAIDDLADRKHDCDVLFDQNLNHGMETRYDGLVSAGCIKLIGPKYALLRPEFVESRQHARSRDGAVRRIFVFFSGSDPSNETGKALEAIRQFGRADIAVDVVVGASNPHQADIGALCAAMPAITLHRQVNNIADLMANADVAIGAGGGAMWERCCVGLPSIVICLAENQRPASEAAARSGRILYLGERQAVSAQLIRSALELVCSSPPLLMNMSEAAMGLVDGRGVERVVQRLLSRPVALRAAQESDCEAIYRWRNAEETRRFSGAGESISFETHVRWYNNVLTDPGRMILIGEADGNPVGVLRYDREGERATVSVYLVPGNQGKGLGPRLLNQGSRWIEENWPAVKAIDAWIKPDNAASISAFKDAGFSGRYKIYTKPVRG